MRIIVCDDDATLRGVVTKLATNAGHKVLAETDSAADAVDMVLRFGAEVLVLDLALPWGAGMRGRARAPRGGSRRARSWCSRATPPTRRRSAALGVRAVIEKPDFEQLEQVLQRVADGGPTVEEVEGQADRRPPTDARERFPEPGPASPSGIEDPDPSTKRCCASSATTASWWCTSPSSTGSEAPTRASSPSTPSCRPPASCGTSSACRIASRSPNRRPTTASPSSPSPSSAAAVRVSSRCGAGSSGPTSWPRAPGILSGGWALVDDVVPGPAALGRASDAAARSTGRPDGERLWAG